MPPVIDGLVKTEEFASKNRDVLDKLVLSWFRTIRCMQPDVQKNSEEIREYLRTTASTRYSPEEYGIAWSMLSQPTHGQLMRFSIKKTHRPIGKDRGIWRAILGGVVTGIVAAVVVRSVYWAGTRADRFVTGIL